MCLTPVVIRNPEFVKRSHEFDLYCVGGVFKKSPILSDCGSSVFYPPSLPKCRDVPVDKLSDYFATCSRSGECVLLYMPVNCGKCAECKESRASSIRARMVLEAASTDIPPIFVTLTYNDDNLPRDGVVKDHISIFTKALHDKLRYRGFPHEFRSIFFSEYGNLHGRPHYHGLIFGLDLDSVKDFIPLQQYVEEAWHRGFVKVERCKHHGVFRYVSKYLIKDAVLPVPDGKNPNFWLGTRRNGGIGSPFLDNPENMARIRIEYPYVSVKGFMSDKPIRVFLPKYIRDKVNPSIRKLVAPHIIEKFKKFCSLTSSIASLLESDFALDIEKYSTSVGELPLDLGSIRRLHSEISRKFFFMESRYKVFSHLMVHDYLPGLDKFWDPDIPRMLHEYTYLYLELSKFEIDPDIFQQFLAQRKFYDQLLDHWLTDYLKSRTIYDSSYQKYWEYCSRTEWASRIVDLQ